MYAWQATVQDEAGNIVPLPVVTVYLNNGTTLASIFNEAGAPLPNPLTGTMEGFVQFWADAGMYNIRGVKGPDSTELWEVSLEVPVFTTRAAASAAAAGWSNGTQLFVNGRSFVVDSTGPDGLHAVDFDWSGKLEDAINRCMSGVAVRFACYGDSTTDGNGTTGWTANPTDGSGNAIGTSAHNPPNAWPSVLRDTIRQMFDNTSISVWNAGYGGKNIFSGWAYNNFARAIINNPAYGTPDVCFINFGLNDIERPAFTRVEMIKKVKAILNLMDYYGITPVFMTPDPVSENTKRQGGRSALIDSIYTEIGLECGVTVIDNRTALNNVYSLNGNNDLWVYQQPDKLHGGNPWHRVKGSFVSAKLFPKTLFINGDITNVAPWSEYANTNNTSYTIADIVNNRFGASMNIDPGSYQAGDVLARVWVWNEQSNMQTMWFSVDGDGYYNPRSLANAPKLSSYNYLSGVTESPVSQTAGGSVGALGYRQGETPMFVSVLNAGLSKVGYIAPSDDNTKAVYLGYFSFRKRVKPVTCSAIIPSSGSGMNVFISDRFGSYGAATGFGVGRTLRMVADVQMPSGSGLILFSQRVFGGGESRVTQNRVALMLYRGVGNISLYQVSIVGGAVSLINGPIASGLYTWASGKNEFGFEMSASGTGQRINVYTPEVTTPVISHVQPLSDTPILSGGDVGGFFYNYASGSGGVASATFYEISN